MKCKAKFSFALFAVLVVIQLLIILYRISSSPTPPQPVKNVDKCRKNHDCEKYSSSGCSVCIEHVCQDLRQGYHCRAAKFVRVIRNYFLKMRWNNIKVMNISCFVGDVVAVQFNFQQGTENENNGYVFLHRQGRDLAKHIHICSHTMWVYLKSPENEVDMEVPTPPEWNETLPLYSSTTKMMTTTSSLSTKSVVRNTTDIEYVEYVDNEY